VDEAHAAEIAYTVKADSAVTKRRRKKVAKATSRSPVKGARSPPRNASITALDPSKTEPTYTAEIEACERFIANYRTIYNKLVTSDESGEVVRQQIANVQEKIETENRRLLDVKMEYQKFLKISIK
jgi:hypothetical protein